MDIALQIRHQLEQALEGLDIPLRQEKKIQFEFSELSHGDYTTNIALKVSGPQFHDNLNTPFEKNVSFTVKNTVAQRLGNPREIAEKIIASIGSIEGVSKIEVAGPGFINFTLEANVVAEKMREATQDSWGKGTSMQDKNVLIEYTDPNPFKAFHIGHLMSNTIGESISRLIENAGATVIRANYQGDLGVHVACAIWGMQQLGISPESADEFGRAYAHGASAYKDEKNQHAKTQIDVLNKKLYERTDTEINQLYDTGRQKSLDAFENIYATLGTKFDHYFFESITAPIGKQIVLAHPDTFVISDGAYVFKGEQYGLHTRVFINSTGLPTYEAKEVGLAQLKMDTYPNIDHVITVTANEISEYFKVLKKVFEIIMPHFASRFTHIPHGFMKLTTGKMSSRTGDIVTGEELLNELKEVARTRAGESRADDVELLATQVAVGAIKYQILRQAINKDTIFDREKALSLDGDSGPYMQYAHARALAIIAKAHEQAIEARVDTTAEPIPLTRLIYRFPDIAARAVELRAPHIVTNYAIELSSTFNSWYAQVQVLDGTDATSHKVAIVSALAHTLSRCLYLLGIPAPEKM